MSSYMMELGNGYYQLMWNTVGTTDYAFPYNFELLSVRLFNLNATAGAYQIKIYQEKAGVVTTYFVVEQKTAAAELFSIFEKPKGIFFDANQSYKITYAQADPAGASLILKRTDEFAQDPKPYQRCGILDWLRGECIHGYT